MEEKYRKLAIAWLSDNDLLEESPSENGEFHHEYDRQHIASLVELLRSTVQLRTVELRAQVAQLEEQVASGRRFLSEALNSGDGTYKP